ncbi:MAG: glycosyltransferase family 39 protein [Eubacterium sp.]|nr:glycosyltransferase family 39 protein [Eubacterium sp.]MCM1303335.1 glycosyltransferase family 39 protein [Butyrivibrio sp.]MCM1342975.1 glycosyltransferase family 39 protein [Muribaculaceae bacterium]MCM1411617.1 glycosyltransferase family 39 protein [Lachnospiraceae bacterium]
MEQAKNRLIKYVFGAAALINLILLLCYAPFAEYAYKRETDMPNVALLAGAIILLLFLYLFIGRFRDRLSAMFGKGYTATGVLFLAELYWTCNAYFRTDWDAGDCLLPAAIELSYGLPVTDPHYFSMYPNNIALVWIQSKVLKLGWRFSILDGGTGEMSLVVLNCLISVIVALLIYRIADKLIGRQAALFIWVVYALYMGLCPWLLISYSDSVVLLFPTLVVWLYTEKERKPWIKWFLIGFCGFGAFYIKPQGCIVLIAVIMVELLEFILNRDKAWKGLLMKGVMILAAVLAVYGIRFLILRDTGLQPEKGRGFGIAHFVMMGLNEESNGGYLREDAMFSYDIADPKERRNIDLQVAGQRVRNYGFAGMLRHLAKKQMVNFGDGTFAWGNEGVFWLKVYEPRNNYMSGMIRSLYYGYEEDNNMHVMETYMQFFWVWIMCFMGAAALRKGRSRAENVCMLSILGVMLFQLLFEARARYLYCYAPLMLLLAVAGFTDLTGKMKNSIKNFRK